MTPGLVMLLHFMNSEEIIIIKNKKSIRDSKGKVAVANGWNFSCLCAEKCQGIIAVASGMICSLGIIWKRMETRVVPALGSTSKENALTWLLLKPPKRVPCSYTACQYKPLQLCPEEMLREKIRN